MKKIDGLERINMKYDKEINGDVNLWYRRNIVIAPYYSMIGDRKKALHIWRLCVCKRPGRVIDNLRYLRAIVREF